MVRNLHPSAGLWSEIYTHPQVLAWKTRPFRPHIPNMTQHGSAPTINKMIHKKTGASFLVIYVIYVSLVYTDSKKAVSCLLPQHAIFATYGRQIKMPTCTHTGRFISAPLCSGQSELACICLFVQFNNQLDV